MTKINTEWALFAIIVMTSMLITATTLAGPVLAVKKSGSSVKTIHKTSNKTTTTAAHNHIRGVKLLSVHTIPSKIAVGNRFSIGVTVFNNSSATITFANGTCTSSPSPLSITFNRNAMIESQASAAATPCKAQQVTLKPGEQSPVLSPNLSGIAYRATASGMTNATMTFKYGVEATTGKSPIGDSISKVLTFNILASGPQPAGLHPSSQPSPLKLPVP